MEGQLIIYATLDYTTNRWPLNEKRGATFEINLENIVVDTFPLIAGTAKSSSNTPVLTVGAS